MNETNGPVTKQELARDKPKPAIAPNVSTREQRKASMKQMQAQRDQSLMQLQKINKRREA